MRVVDLFSGVGGLSLGFVEAGFEVIFAVENDSSIASSYKLNHPNTDVYTSDIQSLDVSRLSVKYKNVDVLIGGPPCQGFSQKGQRLSLDDERNYLFRHFIHFVEVFQPTYFLMENVPNIITTANGFFKNQIIKAFSELGYKVDVNVLSAADFGVPQNRKRAFFLGKKNNKLMLPLTNGRKTTVIEAISDLPQLKSGEGQISYDYLCEPSSDYQLEMRKGSSSIFNHQATKHSDLALKKMALIPKGKGKEVLPEELLTRSIYAGTWTRLKEDGLAATITTRFDTPSSGMFIHPTLDRCITVREGARLQSFPDRFVFHGTKSSQLKQVGNAVPPLLAYEIAKTIKRDN